MASFTTVCLAIVLLVALIDAATIRITTNTFNINPGSTANLNIKCVVENTGIRDYSKVYELLLKRDGQIIALFNADASPISLDAVATPTVTGDLSGTSNNRASLQVVYSSPVAALAGTYVCHAIGVDNNNHNREIEGKVQISTV